jgi:hypothetical protein
MYIEKAPQKEQKLDEDIADVIIIINQTSTAPLNTKINDTYTLNPSALHNLTLIPPFNLEYLEKSPQKEQRSDEEIPVIMFAMVLEEQKVQEGIYRYVHMKLYMCIYVYIHKCIENMYIYFRMYGCK